MLKKIFVSLLFCFATLIVVAQSLNDIQKIKVDQLSDAQIEELIKRAEASGMNEQQLEAMAAQRGMPPGEIAKLRTRINALRRGRPTGADENQRRTQGRQLNEVMGEDIFLSLTLREKDTIPQLTDEQKKIFGFTLFHNKTLDFSPNFNMATPKSYVVGPGDELLIEVYGASQQSYTLLVSPEGFVNIPNLGVVSVSGLTIEAATSRLKNRLSTIYATLTGSNPSSFAQITLGNIRTIKVNMVGELEKPGTYSLPSFANVFNALYAAGGPTTKGTFRNIQVYRGSKLVAEVDVYEFLVKGMSGQNIRLEDNDFVIVKPLERKVEVIGEVRRPGIFEMKADEAFDQLLVYAGGFSANAFKDRVVVKRTADTRLRIDDVPKENYSTFIPRDGDEFRVAELLNLYENRVQISGAIQRPGEYELTDQLTIKGLIEKAGGIMGDAFANRAVIYRTNEDFSLSVVPVSLRDVLNGVAEDVVLQNEDVLSIPRIYDLKEEFFVHIEGEVNRTGVYPYAQGMTVADLITKAGGFKESASGSFIEIARRAENVQTRKIADIISLEISRDLSVSESNQRFALQPFDQIFIRRRPGFQPMQLVEAQGELNYPGLFALNHATMRISDLVKRAGGLSVEAYARGATLIRRTEFYKERTEQQQREEILRRLIAALEERDELTEAEKQQLIRIDKELVGIEKIKLQKQLKEQLEKSTRKEGEEDLDDATLFRQQRMEQLMESSGRRGNKKEFNKEQELVGIDLEKILENPGSAYDLILREGDILSIPTALQTVRVRGEVLYPSTSVFEGRNNFKTYISNSGGFTDEARRKRSYVVYPSGKVDRTKSILFVSSYPRITPGAEIYVPSKPERDRLGAQGWIGIATGMATLAILLNSLLQ